MTDFDGWADLSAQRRAEDDMLVQRYAAGEGRGQDMRPVGGFAGTSATTSARRASSSRSA